MRTVRIALCFAVVLVVSSTPAIAGAKPPEAVPLIGNPNDPIPPPKVVLIDTKRAFSLHLNFPQIVVENRAIYRRVWVGGRHAFGHSLSLNLGVHESAFGALPTADAEPKALTLEDATSAGDIGTCAATGVSAGAIGNGVHSGRLAANSTAKLADVCGAGGCGLDDQRIFPPINAWSFATGTFPLGVSGVSIVARPGGGGGKIGARGKF
jgi:hypothetical protein